MISLFGPDQVPNYLKEEYMRNLVRFMKNEDGATAIEYGLIASLIAVVLIAILTTLGGNLKTTFTSISSAL
jgi:pilus assembly protein Flp/PilA